MTTARPVTGVVVAGGSGERLGADVPKAFVQVAGTSLLARSVTALRAGGIDRVVAVVPVGWEDRARRLLGAGVVVVAGGATRTASVAAGLAATDATDTVVAVHDAARALVPPEVVRAAVTAVTTSGAGTVVAAAPGLPVGDTLKRVDAADEVVGTVPRRDLVGVQTPQVFRRSVLVQAHERAGRVAEDATDDLALVEELVAEGVVDGRIVITPGSPRALKVTHPDDLLVAAALVQDTEVTA